MPDQPFKHPGRETEMNAILHSGAMDAVSAVPVHDANSLTAGGATAHILLNGQLYCLRITRAGKLILTK